MLSNAKVVKLADYGSGGGQRSAGLAQGREVGTAAAAASLTPVERSRLEWLRGVAQQSYLMGRFDAERACELIGADPQLCCSRFASAMISTGARFTKSRFCTYRPGTVAVTHAELWMVSLLSAIEEDDEVSAQVLVKSFVRPEGQRRVRFLADAVARTLLRA